MTFPMRCRSFNEQKGGSDGKCNSVAVVSRHKAPFNQPEIIDQMEVSMQTDIEILETRENPIIVWI